MSSYDDEDVQALVETLENQIRANYLQFLLDHNVDRETIMCNIWLPLTMFDQHFLRWQIDHFREEIPLPPGQGPNNLPDLVKFSAELDIRYMLTQPSDLSDCEDIDLTGLPPEEWAAEEERRDKASFENLLENMLQEWSSNT